MGRQQRSAATAGGPPATSAIAGPAWRASASGRTVTRNMPDPATGTTRTCSWWGKSAGDRPLHPSRLTPNEQLTHISLWCLLSSPLLIGCDMNSMDPFTLALLTNDEVLDVNQDPLGKPAGRGSRRMARPRVWSFRPLFDGTVAVGMFNRGRQMVYKVKVQWSEVEARRPCQTVRWPLAAQRPG